MKRYTQSGTITVVVIGVIAALLSGSETSRMNASALNEPLPAGISGNEIFEAKCAPCHGSNGKGDGIAAMALTPRPRDFSHGVFKFRTTATGSLPTDSDLARTITDGLPGTAMPDWKTFLRNDSLKAVIEQVKSFSHRFETEKPKPITIGNEPPTSAASSKAGQTVYEKMQCATCHGDLGNGIGAVNTDLTDDWNLPIPATNLTEPWTFKGGASARDIYIRLMTGVDGTPMPSFNGAATDRELWDLSHYIVSLGRKPAWQMNAAELKTYYDNQQQEYRSNPVLRGKYLVETHGCFTCHTPARIDGTPIEELRYAGGVKFDIFPFGTYVTHNLTSDKETGLGNWTDDQIKQALTRGVAGKGWRMLPFPMPWTAYAQFSDDDLTAMIAYLRTLPAISNRTPDPEHPNIFSYFWGKFQLLILRTDFPMKAYPGNAGTAPVKEIAQSSPEQRQEAQR